MSGPASKGLLVIVSAPSGAGKGTVLAEAFKRDARLAHSVSATTRKPRASEVPGRDYEFVDKAIFEAWIRDDRLLEWAEVHDNFYGTPRGPLERLMASGYDAVLEIDVQGMRSVRATRPEALTIFIMPPSLEELERRLRSRGGMPEEQIQTRLRNAREEIAAKDEYAHVLVNVDLVQTVEDFLAILENERGRLKIR